MTDPDSEICEGCGGRYYGKTSYTPDDVALCPKCASANRMTAREMFDILANEKVTSFGGTVRFECETPNDQAQPRGASNAPVPPDSGEAI